MAYKDVDHEKEMRNPLREMPMPERRKSLFGGTSREK